MLGRDVTWRNLGTRGKQQSLEVSGIQSKDGARSKRGTRSNYEVSIPLLGSYQLENAATAVATLEALSLKGLNISRDSIISGLAQVSWPGRFQVLSHRPLLVVDGAHNPDAARKLKQSLSEHFNFKRAILIMGASEDKEVASVVSEFIPFFDEVIVTQSRHPRAMEATQLQAVFQEHGVETQLKETVPEALSLAMSLAGTQDLICVSGSLFVVAEAIEWAKGKDYLSRET
jgi:dihydrofolate synthase/folylpolyglutamate synthase